MVGAWCYLGGIVGVGFLIFCGRSEVWNLGDWWLVGAVGGESLVGGVGEGNMRVFVGWGVAIGAGGSSCLLR